MLQFVPVAFVRAHSDSKARINQLLSEIRVEENLVQAHHQELHVDDEKRWIFRELELQATEADQDRALKHVIQNRR